MSESLKKSLLIIDDKKENIKILIELLKSTYTIYFATDGLKGFDLAKSKKPDLILLDIMMDPIDGYEVCKRLKINTITSDIPVVFLTAVSDYKDEAKGFQVGGVDYITKPFVPVVIVERIKNQLRLSGSIKELKRLYSVALDSNPITKLPGNNSIRNHISLLIEGRKKRTVFYIDLDNFKAYNDVYGFANGDRVILALSEIIKDTAEAMNILDIFMGHIGGDDFVITLNNDTAQAYIHNFMRDFDQKIKKYYNTKDIQQGFIRTKSRRGGELNFPIITVSIAGIDLEKTNYGSYLYLSDACAGLRHKAKQRDVSNCLMDKRFNLI
jgi:diguanylate cyclase (GGDEF)-like protein